MGMTKLEKAKQIIEEYLEEAPCGIFDCRNTAGDEMTNIYSADGLDIDICYSWLYFEVFGLSNKEFKELERYYEELIG